MRLIALAIVAAAAGWVAPAHADTAPETDRSLRQMLPLFDQNGCIHVRDLAEQLFCGDPDLHAAGLRMGAAVQDRLNRLPDRLVAIEENVEWIRSRNLSCGIFDFQGIAGQDLQFVKACLLKATEGRIAILQDPDFDCLATNTTAGLLVCSDPALATADRELDELVLALTTGLKDDDAKAAFGEYARWTRDRDRKCDLDDKDNVPLSELSAAEPCLADFFRQKTAEIIAAKGDPRKVFGRPPVSPSPDADAVDLCVAQIHSVNACGNFLRVSRVIQLDTEVSDQEALVTAEVEMKILSTFEACSQIASACSGTCWDAKSGQPKSTRAARQNLPVALRLRIEKSFAFRKTDNGGWRCDTPALQPIELGIALNSNR